MKYRMKVTREHAPLEVGAHYNLQKFANEKSNVNIT